MPFTPVKIGLAAIFFIATCHLAHAQTPNLASSRRVEPSLSYTVKPSDKLIQLSREMLVDAKAWNAVAKYNQLKNPDIIFPGQKLDIPLRYLKFQAANGKIISAEGDVSLGGQPMQLGAAINDGTQLKTGANSSAVIEMGDGSRIKLLPNSLAEVVSNRNYAMRDASASGSTTWFSGLMRLSAGALEALATKNILRATPLQIETATSLVGVRGTEFRVAFEDPATQSTRTEIIEGKVRADNLVQQSGTDLPEGMGAVIKPTEKEIKVVALLPAPDLAGVPAEVFKPQASWPMPVLAGASSYRVQVSSDGQFDKIVRDLKVSTASVDLTSLANGNWFARVRGIDGIGLEGFNSVKLIAIKDSPPAPTEWRVSYSSLKVADGKTVLTWVGLQANGEPMLATGYSAVVARDKALTQTIINAESTEPRLELGDLKPGTYYLRLRSKLAKGGTIDSEVYQMEITGNWGFSVFSQTSALQSLK
ncbi:MAG: FecR domain-containing protein [Polaromonas sp.]|nr:FecR domain-containing protein [Polaromonas sp.]